MKTKSTTRSKRISKNGRQGFGFFIRFSSLGPWQLLDIKMKIKYYWNKHNKHNRHIRVVLIWKVWKIIREPGWICSFSVKNYLRKISQKKIDVYRLHMSS